MVLNIAGRVYSDEIVRVEPESGLSSSSPLQ